MNGAWKMVSSVRGLNPRPHSHKPSALTTRPRLLAEIIIIFEPHGPSHNFFDIMDPRQSILNPYASKP